MTFADGRIVDITANLQAEVDGVPVDVRGAGSTLNVTTDDLPGLVRRMRGMPPLPGTSDPASRRHLGLLADALDAVGVTLTVGSPHAPVVSVGSGVHSPIGRLVTGSGRVRVHASGAGRAYVRHVVVGAGALAGFAVAVGIAAGRRSR